MKVDQIRRANPEELDTIRTIEVAAGKLFAGIGIQTVADDEPPSIDELAEFQRAGRAWVAVDDEDAPIAYVIFRPLEGSVHIEQVSVHPDHQRRGIGRRLLDEVAEWTRSQNLSSVTLTTFRDVPWNAPYYSRCGFRALPGEELTPGLREVLEAEHQRGPQDRVAMRRNL